MNRRAKQREEPGFVGSSDLVVSFGPGYDGEIPPPFVVAARTVRLLEVEAPRVLILGFGLGAMARFLLEHRPRAQVVGVEPVAKMVKEARAHFDAGFGDQVQIERSTAAEFLAGEAHAGEGFDLIIDDCYEMRDGDAHRPVGANESAERLAALLRGDHGIVVRNLLLSDGSIAEQTQDLARVFAHRMERTFRDWENVLVLASQRAFVEDARRRLSRD